MGCRISRCDDAARLLRLLILPLATTCCAAAGCQLLTTAATASLLPSWSDLQIYTRNQGVLSPLMLADWLHTNLPLVRLWRKAPASTCTCWTLESAPATQNSNHIPTAWGPATRRRAETAVMLAPTAAGMQAATPAAAPAMQVLWGVVLAASSCQRVWWPRLMQCLVAAAQRTATGMAHMWQLSSGVRALCSMSGGRGASLMWADVADIGALQIAPRGNARVSPARMQLAHVSSTPAASA